ncbi:MAG: T9SS type A sorting domain-containing protein, partial [bacterium]
FNWVSGPLAYVHGFLYLAGSHQWVSRDSGRTWEVRPSADEICDGGVAFVDTLHGWTGGGRISPQSEGWVHRTTDGGHTWSERLLETDYPIRTVHFLNRQLGFAAGGNYEEGIGGIWSTTDGGGTWQEDIAVSAEITVLGSHRHSPAYVDVFAAGFFPDFVGGVWHTRLLVPDTIGPVLVARPDTLDFGALLPGERDTLSFWTINFGSDSIIVNGFYISDTVFKALPDTTIFVLVPGDSVEIPVEFHPRSVGIYTATIYISNSEYQDVHVVCRGEGSDVAAHTHESLLPQEASVSVYPNPGNPDFTISFALPTRADIRLSVYNVLGQRVAVLASGPHDAGSHRLIWRADDLPSGIYFVRLEGIPSPKITKLCLLR